MAAGLKTYCTLLVVLLVVFTNQVAMAELFNHSISSNSRSSISGLDLKSETPEENTNAFNTSNANFADHTFITVWQTDNPGSSNDNQITIPTTGVGYNYDIYWEEFGNPTNNGTEPVGQTGDYTITFPTPGTYLVEISGDFPSIYFNAASFNSDKDSHKLLSIEQWGDIAWTSMEYSFAGCENLALNAIDAPDLSGVTSLRGMFYEAESFNSDINGWDVSTILDMHELFRDAILFNQPLDNWDVSNVTDMSSMFFFADAFNQDISSWVVSNVTNMNFLFAGAILFNQNIGSWDMSGVTNTNQMFANANAFNQDISGWDITSVTDMRSMFSGATVFNQDVSSWDISGANRLSNLFRNAEAFNQDISGWDVSTITDMSGMFAGATSFDQDLSSWDMASVQNMNLMFAFTNYNQDITGWDVSGATNLGGMFDNNPVFNQDISGWEVSSVTDMRNMFTNATAFDQDLGGWNVIGLRFAFNMLNSSGMSIENYDKLLIGWSLLTLQSNVSFNAQGIFYCAGSTARAEIISNFNWFINDSGPSCISVFQGPDLSGQEVPNGSLTPIDFGSQVVGADRTLEFTIRNNIAADIVNLVVTAPTSEYSLLVPSTIIATGSTLTIQVTFNGSAPGTFNETISITSTNFSDPFTFDITAKATLVAEPEIAVFEGPDVTGIPIEDGSPGGIFLGTADRGTDLTGEITIANIGSADLNISDLTIGNAVISLSPSTPPGLTIAPDASQTITITIDGSVSGFYQELLTITNTDVDEPAYTFPVIGDINGPIITVFRGLNFASDEIIFNGQVNGVDVGTTLLGQSRTAQVTVANFGFVDLEISTISVSGSEFMVTPAGPETILREIDGVVSDLVLNVTLIGSTLGVFSETITIESDDDVNPTFTFGVTGSVINPPNIYWTENIGEVTGDDEIHRTDLDGNNFTQYYSGFSDEISGLAIDTIANRLYWTDAAQASIAYGEIGATGLASGPTVIFDDNPSSSNAMVDLALDLANGHIYFTHGDAENGFQNKIVRMDLNGSNRVELIDLSFEKPFGIDLDLINNKIYFTTNILSTGHDARLYRMDLTGSNLEELVYLPSATVDPIFFRDVKIDPVNNIVYWATGEEDLPGVIFYNNLNEAAPYSASTSFTTTGEVRGLDLDPINEKLYWMCRGANDGVVPAAVMRSDFDGNNKELVFEVTLYPPSYPPAPAGSAFIALDLRGIAACTTPPTASAGPDQNICEGSLIAMTASIGGGASTSTWTSTGDGSFDDPTSISAQYTPGANDISSGSATLILTTDGPGLCTPASDDLLLTITAQATISLDQDFGICAGDVPVINAVIGGGATMLTWTTSGDGTFEDVNSATAVYTPGSSDLSNGQVTLTATTDDPDGAGFCTAASGSVIITIDDVQTVDAGVDQSICPTDPVVLNGTIGGSALSATWSTNGDGTFGDAANLSTTYTPGTNDASSGTIILTLTTTAGAACPSVSDVITIDIKAPITAADQSPAVNVAVATIIDVTNGSTLNTGDVLTTTLLTNPQKGSAVINTDGSITYTAAQETVGADGFDYQICNQCGQCSSASANITINNEPPAVDVPPGEVISGGVAVIDVLSGISDVNGNIDLSSLTVLVPPISGATASFDSNGNLLVDYSGLVFTGRDELTIEVCDVDQLCTSQIVIIDVVPPTVIVYNAVSPNGDGKHDFLEIENAEFFPDNQVQILNRWGAIVFQMSGYNNDSNKFDGEGNQGSSSELTAGTYYYNINLGDGSKDITGYFSLRK